jgi:hypothetical protein
MRLLVVLCILLITGICNAAELHTLTFNSGPYHCGHKINDIHEILWMNDGPPIKIKSSVIWIGADRGALGDTMTNLFRLSDGNLINSFGWDRYRNPSSPHQIEKDFGDNFITIGTGDGISMQYFCNMSPSGCHGHTAVYIWYLLE